MHSFSKSQKPLLLSLLRFFARIFCLPSLPSAYFLAQKPLFPFSSAQFFQLFLLKSEQFSKLTFGFWSTNKSATFLLLLSCFHSVLATFSSSPSFLLSYTVWQIWQEQSIFFFFFCGCNGFRSHISSGNGAADKLFQSPTVSCCLSPLTSRIRLSLFRAGSVLPHQNCLIHKYLHYPRKNLYIRVTLAMCSLPFTATDTTSCNKLSFSCSDRDHSIQNISHLILSGPASDSLPRSLFDDSLSVYDLLFRL